MPSMGSHSRSYRGEYHNSSRKHHSDYKDGGKRDYDSRVTHRSSGSDERHRKHETNGGKRTRERSPSPLSKKPKHSELGNIQNDEVKLETHYEHHQEESIDAQTFSKNVLDQLEQVNEDADAITARARQRRIAILEKHRNAENQGPSQPNSPPIFEENSRESVAETEPTVKSPSEEPKVLSHLENRKDSPSPAQAEDFDMFGNSPVPVVEGSTNSNSPRKKELDDEDMFGPSSTGSDPKVHHLAAEIESDAEGYCKIRIGDILDSGRYQILGKCGMGTFSRVFKARDLQCTEGNAEVVLKVIRNNDMMKKVGMKEMEFLQRAADQDPKDMYGCVRLLRHFVDREFLCLVFESMACDLREVIKKYGRGGLSVKAVQVFSNKLLLSIYHLKKIGLIHADIKPDNILVNEAKTTVKLADFGSASELHDNPITPYLVTGWYRAPEIILGLPYSIEIDMWSVACCIYELATGNILFKGKSNNDMLRMQMELKGMIPRKMVKKSMFKDKYFDDNFQFLMLKTDPITKREYTYPTTFTTPTRDMKAELLKGTPPEDVKKVTALHDLLEKCLILDPSKRMTVEDALQHPFFTV